MPRHRGPPALGLGQRGVDRAGRDVAAEHEVQAVPLLLDDPHPPPKGALALLRQAVHPPGLAGLGRSGPRLDQAVPLELGKCTIDARAVDATEAQVFQPLGEVVAVAGLLGQQEQERGQEEAAGRGELEARVLRHRPGRVGSAMLHRTPWTPGPG